MFFTGMVAPPSALLQILTIPPAMVIFEKLLNSWLMVLPANDPEELLYPTKKTVPDGLEKAVTMLLLLQFSVWPALSAIIPDRLIKVTLPVVLLTRFVNVLLLILLVEAPDGECVKLI